jgi:DNA protecting protein DprA
VYRLTQQNHLPLFNDPPPASTPRVDAKDVLALSMVKGLGLKGIRGLASHFGDLAKVWQASMDELFGALISARLTFSATVVIAIQEQADALQAKGEKELKALKARDITIVTVDDSRFPRGLLDVTDPPFWIFIEGDPSSLSLPDRVALVGSRTPTAQGTKLSLKVASWLVRRDITIVSGLAEGIDAVGHQAAVDAGRPTLAILGHGLDVAFPASTVLLRQEILRAGGGAVISEYFPGERYDSRKFVQRNRLQAGLGQAVIVTDAQYASGTAHTARFAAEYKRPLVGVRSNGYEAGILKLVRELGGETVDLNAVESNEQLASVLAVAFGHPVQAQAVHPEIDKTARAIAEMRRIFAGIDRTTLDADRILSELSKLLGRETNSI